MKTILVPTDLTGIAESGLKLAVDIAEVKGGKIVLFNVICPVHGTTFTTMDDINMMPRGQADRFMVERIRKNKSGIEALAKKYHKENVTIDPQIDFEDKVNGLNGFIRKWHIDLVVLGTRGAKSLSEFYFGSRTENVTRASGVPVILTKESIEEFFPKNIVLPVDTTENAPDIIEEMQAFAAQFKSRIHLLSIMHNGDDTAAVMDKMRNIAESAGFSDYSLNTYINGNPEQAIRSFSQRINADLMAVLSLEREGADRQLFGNLASKLVNSSKIPVLVISRER
jgi:nucleotide-binding universal stress UspA family protein